LFFKCIDQSDLLSTREEYKLLGLYRNLSQVQPSLTGMVKCGWYDKCINETKKINLIFTKYISNAHNKYLCGYAAKMKSDRHLNFTFIFVLNRQQTSQKIDLRKTLLRLDNKYVRIRETTHWFTKEIRILILPIL